MDIRNRIALAGAMVGLAITGVANATCPCEAGSIIVDADIIVDTVWDAAEVYCITDRVTVRNGASLTIPAGTQVRSSEGGLVVVRGSQIFVNGTATEPVVMTSSCDTGYWRESANEWGNLTVMGNGIISGSHSGGAPALNSSGGANPLVPDGTTERRMEGLTIGPIPADSFYGGNDDDDDSGSITYLSIRYGGQVLGLGDELNGLSLGGVGRNTEISHVEIMNNVDDGIEIWGGTVNVKYFAIWNIGDDSFDLDQGWRGKAQFGLIVQGYSLDASQGSGVGDNMIEADGAERGDAQPLLTSTIYNVTSVGQPLDGDHAFALRDNARLQFRNFVVMDAGDRVVSNDGDAGEGGGGYGGGLSGVPLAHLSFADTWATAYTVLPADNAGIDDVGCACSPASLYTVQSAGSLAGQGRLLELTDSVFFNNSNYTEADAQDVFNPDNGNVDEPGVSPIAGIIRAGAVVKGGKVMQRVLWIDPTATNDAAASLGSAPADGFFDSVSYRGGFAPAGPRGSTNWLEGWSAAAEYGIVGDQPCLTDFDGSGVTDLGDLLAVISNWGDNYFGGRPADADDIPGDVDRNEVVELADLLAIISNWGSSCP